MKLKITLLSAFVALFFSVNAQQLTNFGFETWDANNVYPTGYSDWESLSALVPNHFTFKDTSRVEGQYSVRIVTDTITLPPNNNQVTLAGVVAYGPGTLGTSGFTLSGVAFPFRPDTIFFSYKYISPATDTGIISLGLAKGATSVFQRYILLTKDSAWQSGYVVIKDLYTTADTPDKIYLYFSSSFRAPVLDSKLNIDLVGFGYVDHTGIKGLKEELGLKVYPNPVSTMLNISANKNLDGCNIKVYNLSGQLVSSQVLEGSSNALNLSGLSCGTYIYQITNKENKLIDQSKITVAK